MAKHGTRKHLTESLRTLIQPGNEIWPTYAILQKKDFYQKIIQKIWPRN